MLKKAGIALNDSVIQGVGNITSDMDGERVMMNIQNGKYYNLGKMGGQIWDMMQDSIKVEELVSNLLSSYEVEREECEEQVTSFLEHLWEEKLIRVGS